MSYDNKFIEAVTKIVETVLKNNGLMTGEWHIGKVAGVLNQKQISVYIDGSTIPQTIAANPDISFNVSDEIFVLYVNGDSKNKFAFCRRAV